MKFSHPIRNLLLVAVVLISALIPAMASAKSTGGNAIRQQATATSITNAPPAVALDSTLIREDRASTTAKVEARPRRVLTTSETASLQPSQAIASDRSLTRPRRVTLRPPDASFTADPVPNRPPDGSAKVLQRPRTTINSDYNSLGHILDWRRILGIK